MTREKVIEMLNAKIKCMKRETSGLYVECNNGNCDNCDLCYQQNNFGGQRECLKMAIEALKEDPRIHSHWEIAIGYDPKKKVQCQNCKLMNYEVTQHCPHCGAIMDEGE